MAQNPELSASLAVLPYRLGVGMMLINEQDQVFVGKRIDTQLEAWQMPQGGVDEGETPEQAAFRELAEEAGVTQATILATGDTPYTYDLPAKLIPTVWGGRYRGQQQHWFLMRLVGDDRAIDIATEHPEFCAWQWVPMAHLPDLIVPFKRPLYTALVAEFARKLEALRG